MTPDAPDRLIRRALTPDEGIHAPAGLTDDILSAIATAGVAPSRPTSVASRQRRLLTLAAVAALLAAAIAGMAVAALRLWPLAPLGVTDFYGNAGRTGVHAGPAPGGPAEVGWEAELSGAMLWLHQPLIVDGVAYAVDARGGAFAFDLATGRQRWASDLDTKVDGAPLLLDGRLIAAGQDGRVVAVDAQHGSAAWETDLRTAVEAGLAAADGLALVVGDDGVLHALRPADGVEAWSLELGAGAGRPPAISDGIAYVGGTDGTLRAVDLETHQIVWELPLGAVALATPVVGEGMVVVVSGVEGGPDPFRLRTFDVESRVQRLDWKAPTLDRLNTPALRAGILYAPSTSGTLYRIDASSGASTTLVDVGAVLPVLPALVGDTVIASVADGTVRAVGATSGEALWSVETPGAPSSAAVAEGWAVVGTSRGSLIGIREVKGPPP